METRRMIFALAAAFAVYLASSFIIGKYFPQTTRPQRPATQPALDQGPVPPGTVPAQLPRSTPGQLPAGPSTTGAAPGAVQPNAMPTWKGVEPAAGPIELGAQDDSLKIRLEQAGASVASIWLTERKNGRLVHRAGPDREQEEMPYEIIGPVAERVNGGPLHHSFVTHRILINKQPYDLRNLVWAYAGESDRKATFTATLFDGPDSDKKLLRITKTYELVPQKPLVLIHVAVENLGEQEYRVEIESDGPIGVRKENLQWDMRNLIAAQRLEGIVNASVVKKRADLQKAYEKGEPIRFAPLDGGPFVWTALTNKFFGVFTRLLPSEDDQAARIATAYGLVAARGREDNPGDLLARFITEERPLAPGAATSFTMEIYAGPKEPQVLEKVNPLYADDTKIGYSIAQAVDYRCCTFQPLPQIMGWLVRKLELLAGNYGVAIIFLVIIVRTLMHPLTVFQQKSMFRMQDAMAKLQPKLNVIKEKHANDKVRLNQEMMKLYAEENVNPAAGMLGMLPIIVQMPILVALWTALNTDVHLRNAPFILWMHDLSSPDALYTFRGEGLRIPLISWLFGPVKSLNIVPILMGFSMYLQQKYMPKPGMQAKLEAAKKAPPSTPKKAGGMTPEEQMRQQQMIAYMMSILFPLLFYRMPSGLTLYWMATNVFGICESLLIRKQLRLEKERTDKEGPKPPKPKRTGLVGKFFKHIAAQAEDLQKKADALSDQKTGAAGRKGPSGGGTKRK